MIIENPSTEVRKQVLESLHRLWCFLLGPIYYAFKGMWGSVVLSLFTLNGLFVVFPLWNREIVRWHYEKAGWMVMDVS